MLFDFRPYKYETKKFSLSLTHKNIHSEFSHLTSILPHLGKRNENQSMLGDLPGGPVVKHLSCNAGDMGLNPVKEQRSHMLQSS